MKHCILAAALALSLTGCAPWDHGWSDESGSVSGVAYTHHQASISATNFSHAPITVTISGQSYYPTNDCEAPALSPVTETIAPGDHAEFGSGVDCAVDGGGYLWSLSYTTPDGHIESQTVWAEHLHFSYLCDSIGCHADLTCDGHLCSPY